MTKYTQRQKSEIEYLINRGKSIHKRMEETPQRDELYSKLNDELNEVKIQLNDALNAEAMFKEHLRAAKEHLAAADAIKERWVGGKHERM